MIAGSFGGARGGLPLALRWLDKAPFWLAWLKLDPRLDGLRSDPRFQGLQRKIGFPP